MDSYSGFCYRVISLETYERVKATGTGNSFDGNGARRVGGRCNLRGLRTAYVSQDPPTAMAEALGTRNLYNVGPMKPMVVESAHLVIGEVVDLTDRSVRRAHGLTLKDLRVDWQKAIAPTKVQVVCTNLAARGTKAVRFPSTKSTGANLAVFIDNLDAYDVFKRHDGTPV